MRQYTIDGISSLFPVLTRISDDDFIQDILNEAVTLNGFCTLKFGGKKFIAGSYLTDKVPV